MRLGVVKSTSWLIAWLALIHETHVRHKRAVHEIFLRYSRVTILFFL